MTDFIRFDRISKSFGEQRVVDGLDLSVGRGEFLSLLGPSGSGKTTILMMMAGFVSPTSGRIFVDERAIETMPPHKRDLGVVFQNYALFPHMTIAENVAFPLKMRSVGKATRNEKVRRALDMVQLGALADRRPAQLSGGQQQRIALARALVYEPKVVLLDEPLGALDKQLREEMQLELRDIHRSLGVTMIFVTHDQSEALTMSDRIAVFNRGRIEQLGSPRNIYDHPKSRFVAEFIGETNVIEAKVTGHRDGIAEVLAEGGHRLRVRSENDVAVGRDVLVCVRPERLDIGEDGSVPNALAATIADTVYQGDHIRMKLQAAGLQLVGRRERRQHEVTTDSRTYVSFAPDQCSLMVE